MKLWQALAWILAAGLTSYCTHNAFSADGWQNHPVCVPEEQGSNLGICQYWIGNVKQPDNPNTSCCGEADAFQADSFKVKDGVFYAIITDGKGFIPNGTEVPIPPYKINPAYQHDGNPTGHGVVFLTSGLRVLCYFGPGLI